MTSVFYCQVFEAPLPQKQSESNPCLIEMQHLSRAALSRWTKVHELLIEQRIRKDMLAQAVKESSAMLRFVVDDTYKCNNPLC